MEEHRDERGPRTIDWDAAAYVRLSIPQQFWAEEVLARLDVTGQRRSSTSGAVPGSSANGWSP
jgi:hypothetical protein